MSDSHSISLAANSEFSQEPNSEFKPNCPELENLLTEVNALAHRLSQLGRGDASTILPFAAHQVLQALDRNGPQSVPALARLRSTSRQNLQILVDRLTKHGCVTSTSNPAHKSSPLFDLTAKGRAMLDAGKAEYSGLLEALAGNGSKGRFREAAEILRKLRLSIPPRQPRSGATVFLQQGHGSASQRPSTAEAVPPQTETEFPVSLL